VVLRFTPEAAEDAERWLFHPSQNMMRDEDGSLTVRFRAGGVQEMCWHLFTWGTELTIIAPTTLRAAAAAMTAVVAQHHAIQESRELHRTALATLPSAIKE
jgi:predicted DNA-binding transcriptional regulator YafY